MLLLVLAICASSCRAITDPAGYRSVTAIQSLAVADSVSVVQVCPGRFVIRNRDVVSAMVSFVMTPASLNQSVEVVAKHPALGWSESFVTFGQPGQMTAFVGTRQVAAATYTLTPTCPALSAPPLLTPNRADSTVFAGVPLVSGAPLQAWNQYALDLLWLQFAPTATPQMRTSALRLVAGVVIGGVTSVSGDGPLIVRLLHGDGTALRALRAVEALKSKAGVMSVRPVARLDGDGDSYVKPHDGPFWQTWSVDRAAIAPGSSTWHLEDIRAPLAWGCPVGDSSVRVAVLDSDADTSLNKSDLARNSTAVWRGSSAHSPYSAITHLPSRAS